MRTDQYCQYTLWGHAILSHEEGMRHERFGGSGTIMRDSKVVVASGVLGAFGTDDDGESAGLSWCRARVDNHG